MLTNPTSTAQPTCRFFSSSFAPRSSHFYTPFAGECTAIKANPAWQFESTAFYLDLPDAGGNCAAGTVPLYRAYNAGQGGAPNHRYTTSAATLDQMLAAGWVAEGHGVTRAFACVPREGVPVSTEIRIEKIAFGAHVLSVYLPAGYESATAPLPVIYALDAEQRFGRLTDVLTATRYDVVLVGIPQLSAAQRFVDYLLPGARAYFDFLADGLIPFVEARYRVDASNRSLSGHSLTGLFVVYAMMLENPQHRVFANYLSADGSFQFDPAAMVGLMRDAYTRSASLPVKVAMSSSMRGNSSQVRSMSEQLRNTFADVSLEEKVYSEDHVGMDVPGFRDALSFVFGAAR